MKIKLIVGIMLMTMAILISGLAGLVSIIGMMALFPAGGITIVAIMALLESSKLLIAGWTHANWKSKIVPRWLKAYMVAAVITLMAITGMGVYGFMTKAHIEQNAPTASVQIDIDQKETALDQLEVQRTQLQTQQNQINETVASYLEGGRAQGAGTFIRQQRAEQARIQAEVSDLNDQITAANVALAPLRREIAGSEAKLGPLQSVAELLGLKDPAGAVKFIILMLMFCFDPLAVGSMIAATIAIGEYLRLRREAALEESHQPTVVPAETDALDESPEIEEALPENWLDWNEADALVNGPTARAEHEKSLDTVTVTAPPVLPLPDVEPILTSSPPPLTDEDFTGVIVPSPAPKFGGVVEPIRHFLSNSVQEPVDEVGEKQDNTAVLISILENDPALMNDLIAAITASPRTETAETAEEPATESDPIHDVRPLVWLEPRTKDE